MESKLVLLIEDNSDDEELTLRELRKNCLANRISVARDGAQALEILFNVPEKLQCVLLDLNLPKIDGLEVLQRIRADKRTQALPVVVLTTSNEDKDRIRAYNLGVNGYVRKPLGFREFGEATRQLGLHWLLLHKLPSRGNHFQPVL